MKSAFVLFLNVLVCVVGVISVWAQSDDLFRRGFEASLSRSWEDAVYWYNMAIAADPRNPEAYFQRGVNFEMLDKTDEAIADYRKVLEIKPDYYLALEYLAKVYERRGDYASAAETYAKALPLIEDVKWRGIVRKWLTDSKQKIKTETDRPQPSGGASARKPIY